MNFDFKTVLAETQSYRMDTFFFSFPFRCPSYNVCVGSFSQKCNPEVKDRPALFVRGLWYIELGN